MYLSCVSEIRVELATEYLYHILYTAIGLHCTVIFIYFVPFNPLRTKLDMNVNEGETN
jgi:hypothetical protein